MVILSLIVKRIRVKALVKDKRAAVEAFGTYVEVGILQLAFFKLVMSVYSFFGNCFLLYIVVLMILLIDLLHGVSVVLKANGWRYK